MGHFIRARHSVCAFALLSVAIAAGASAYAGQPTTGRFLVASRGQPGVFARSVVLLIACGPHGALGVIVNRPTKVALAKALADPPRLNGQPHPLYFGGPVALDHLTILIRAKTKPPDAVHVIGDIYASGSMDALRAVAAHKIADASFRGYAGYAGWAPGQLEDEIARGGWKVLPASDRDVFTKDPASLWGKLIRQKAPILVNLSPPKRLTTGGPRRMVATQL
jgi:putative transcriptional regulator